MVMNDAKMFFSDFGVCGRVKNESCRLIVKATGRADPCLKRERELGSPKNGCRAKVTSSDIAFGMAKTSVWAAD